MTSLLKRVVVVAAHSKNDPFRFQGEGLTFKGKLIGSEPVVQARGDKVCSDAMNRLKAVVKASGEHKLRVSLTVSLEGIKVYDEKTRELLCHHPVHRISFISQDPNDPRAFGYVAGHPGGHQFVAIKTEKPASQVVIALRDLFQTVLEMKQLEMKRKSGTASSSTLGIGDLGSGSPSSTVSKGIDQMEGEITSAEATFGSDPFGSTPEVSRTNTAIESNGYFQPNKVCLPPVNSTPQPLLPPPPTSSLPSTPKKTTGQTRQTHGSSGTSATFSDFTSIQASMTLPKGFTSSTAPASSWLEGSQQVSQRASPSPAQVTTSDMAAATSKPASGAPSTAPPTSSQISQFNFDSFDLSKANLPPPPSRGSQQGRSNNNSSTSSALLTLGEISSQLPATNTQSLPRPQQPAILDEQNVSRVMLPPSCAPSGGFNAVFENARPNSGLIGNVVPHCSSSVDSVFNDDFRFTQPAPVQREANFSASQFSFESVASSLSRARTQESTELFELTTANRAAIVAAASTTAAAAAMTSVNPIEHMGSSSSFSSSTVHSGSETASPRFHGGLSSCSPPCNREPADIPPADKYAVFEELKHEEASKETLSFAPPEVNKAIVNSNGTGIYPTVAAIQPLPQTANTSVSTDLFADFAAFQNTSVQPIPAQTKSFFNDSGFNSTVLDKSKSFANFDQSFGFSAPTSNNDTFETNFDDMATNNQNKFFGESDPAFESNFDVFDAGSTNKSNETAAKRPPMLNAAMRSNPFCALSTESTPSEDFNTPQLALAPLRKGGASSNDNSVCSPSDATTATNQFVSAASSPSSDRFVTMASGSSLSSSENDLSAPCPTVAAPQLLSSLSNTGQIQIPFPVPSAATQSPSNSQSPFPPFAFDAPAITPAVSFASPVVVPSPAHEAASTAVNPFCMGSFSQLPSQKKGVETDEGFCGSAAGSVSPHLPQTMNCDIQQSSPFVATFPTINGDQAANGGIFMKKPNPFNEDFFNMLNSTPVEPAGQQKQPFDALW